jgi:hypothetical protein
MLDGQCPAPEAVHGHHGRVSQKAFKYVFAHQTGGTRNDDGSTLHA